MIGFDGTFHEKGANGNVPKIKQKTNKFNS